MIFNRKLSKEYEYGRDQGSEYDFLNRSPRSSVERIRVLIEEWFNHIPDKEKSRLAVSLKSKDNLTHQSAFFELFCHELLIKQDFSVIMHAQSVNKRAKDFRAVQGDDIIEAEATICTEADMHSAETKNIGNLIDFIDERAFVPGFRYAIDIIKNGKNLPGLRRLTEDIVEWTKLHNRKELRSTLEADNSANMPSKVFVNSDWEIEITLLPRPSDEEEYDGFKKSIGIGPIQSSHLHHERALLNTLTKKASHYNDYSYPYVIAINPIFKFPMHDDIAVIQALLGSEQIPVDLRTSIFRKPSGLWIGPNGPRNKKVSSVIIADRLKSWNICKSRVKLYLNPYAIHPVPVVLFHLDTCSWNIKTGERIENKGKPINELFGLDPEWPGDD